MIIKIFSKKNKILIIKYNDNNDNQVLLTNSSDDENYVLKTKVCKRLSKEFKLEEVFIDESTLTPPPNEHGLSNAEVIIPSYYRLHKHPSKILDIDFYAIIKDDIRNCRVLNKYQLEYIKKLNDESKYELIEIFNQCVKLFNDMFNET